MEILTLRSPGRAPHTYRLYSIVLEHHNITYLVQKTEWGGSLDFRPHADIQTAFSIREWHIDFHTMLRGTYSPVTTRNLHQFENYVSIPQIVKLISADNPGWIALTDCSTDMVLRHFLLRRPPAVENRPTLSETLRTTEAAMRGLAATVSAVAPSMEVGLDGLWELARALQLPERVLDGQYKGSFSTDSLRFEVRKPENIADTVDDLREASETAKKYLAEREAEEERLRALRDEEARKPPTRSGSIEQ